MIFYIQINPLRIKKRKDDDGWGSSCALTSKARQTLHFALSGSRARIDRRGKEKNKTEKEYVQRKTENSYAGSWQNQVHLHMQADYIQATPWPLHHSATQLLARRS